MAGSIHHERNQRRAQHFAAAAEPEPEQEQEPTLADLTKAELLERAAAADIEGRSFMNKDELIEALNEEET